MAIVHLQMDQLPEAKALLDTIQGKKLEQRAYLVYGCYADYYRKLGDREQAVRFLDQAIALTSNDLERKYLIEKKIMMGME